MKKIIWIIIGVLLVGGGVMAVKKKKQAMAQISPMKVYHQVVSVISPKTGDILLTLPALAEVRSDLDVVLSSKFSSRITSMVKSGDTVHRGQVVVTLDHEGLLTRKETIELRIISTESEISAQQVALDTALAAHKRTKALLDVRGASIEQYEMEKSKIAAIRAGLKNLNSKKGELKQNGKEVANLLSYAVIVSPVDGQVSSTSANVGVMAMPGKPLLSIRSASGKYLLVRSADDIRPREVIFAGRRYPLVPLNHTYRGLDEYRADMETKNTSGERLSVRLVIYHGPGTMIPMSALLQKDDHTLCFVPNGNKALPVPVKVIASGTEGVVIKGLPPRQVIVAQPDILLKLLAGNPIIIKGYISREEHHGGE